MGAGRDSLKEFKSFYSGTLVDKVKEHVTASCKVKLGVRQASVMSLRLSNIYMDEAIKEVRERMMVARASLSLDSKNWKM